MKDSLSRHQIGVNPYPNSITDSSNGAKIPNCVTVGKIEGKSSIGKVGLTAEMLDLLHRGGAWANYWTPDSGEFYIDKYTRDQVERKISLFFPTDKRPAVPASWKDSNVYFGVHPQTHNQPPYMRSRISTVAAINVFFAEFDVKDFGSKAAILAHLATLPIYPTAVVDSGGGYHCYWILEHTVIVADSNRVSMQRLQAAWVTLVGGDFASRDLARVLRVPGTQNRKEHFAPNYPVVEFHEARFDRLYRLTDFEQLTEELRKKKPATSAGHITADGSGCADEDVIKQFNQKVLIEDALSAYGYYRAHGDRWVRPGGENGSVQVKPQENVSFHHNTNDSLHKPSATGGLAPIDPFEAFTVYEHNGNRKNAFIAAKKQLGLWRVATPAVPEIPSWMNDAPPPVDGLAPVSPPTQPVAAKPVERRTRFTVAQLYATEFPEPKYAVIDLLPEGQTLLIARPKIGKSWLSLQIAVAVGMGGTVLGQKAEQGNAFYLALEDRPRRMADRLRKMSAPDNTKLVIENKWPPLHQGGAELLMKEIDKEGYSLVIVDTLQRAFAGLDMVKDGAKVTKLLAELQEFALERHVALMIVHHQRKSSGAVVDAIDDALGATGIAANADAAWLITRQRGQQTATFQVTGRDIEEKELAINFDKASFCWQLQGDADGVRSDTVQGRILAALEEFDEYQATAAELGRFLGVLPDNVTRELGELLSKGKVVKSNKKGRNVYYKLADKVNELKNSLADDRALPARADIDG